MLIPFTLWLSFGKDKYYSTNNFYVTNCYNKDHPCQRRKKKHWLWKFRQNLFMIDKAKNTRTP